MRCCYGWSWSYKYGCNKIYSKLFVIISSISVLLNLLVVILPTCFKFLKIEENQTDVNTETSQKDSSTVKFVRSLMCQRVVGVPESKVTTSYDIFFLNSYEKLKAIFLSHLE